MLAGHCPNDEPGEGLCPGNGLVRELYASRDSAKAMEAADRLG